jgi:hypothetical protein
MENAEYRYCLRAKVAAYYENKMKRGLQLFYDAIQTLQNKHIKTCKNLYF